MPHQRLQHLFTSSNWLTVVDHANIATSPHSIPRPLYFCSSPSHDPSSILLSVLLSHSSLQFFVGFQGCKIVDGDFSGGECSLGHEDVRLKFDDYESESLGWHSSKFYRI
ncbi:unnamed protein product [Amaranthus hypochondriacus]